MIKKNIGYRPTYAQINLSNIIFNYKAVKKIVSKNTKVMVCVKADAYGHGLFPVAQELVSQGVDYLGVASIDEGIALRKARIKVPVLVLGAVLKEHIATIFDYRLSATVCSEEAALALHSLAKKRKQKVKIHIKIDTGMGRLGILPEQAVSFVRKISKLTFLKLEGIFTHFPCADVNRQFTLVQAEKLRSLANILRKGGVNIPLAHAANSVGLILFKEAHFDMVRPGLMIYGLYPKDGLDLALKPVLSLKTKVVYKKRVPAGYGVSYCRSYITRKETTIVTLPIGYGDGYPRNLSNTGPVLIGGKRFCISGRICMDQVMVDVGDEPVSVGDEVVLIGAQGSQKITAEELAKLSKTIPYEIVCGLGSRIPRVYTR